MREHMQVTLAADGQRLQIRCPFWANDLVRSLPDRRWSKKERAWLVPLLRQNVEAVKRLIAMDGVNVDAAAEQALKSYAERRVKQQSRGFPAWYQFRTKLERIDEPGVFDEFPIRKHQLNVLNKKYGLTAFALHHDMGTGKTRTEVDYACALRMEGKIDAVLVAVKLAGRRNWLEQFAGPMSIRGVTYKTGWAPIPVDVYLPTTDDRRGFERWLARKHDFKVMVIGIESLSQGGMAQMAETFMAVAGRVLMIVDESSLIANHKASRTEQCIRLGRMAAFRDTMTGTPISTGPLNLFSQFEYLDPDIIGIGDFYAFRNRYATVLEKKTKTGQKYPLIVGYQNIDELTKAIAPYTDEVRKSDVLELPPKNILPNRYVQLSKPQRELYDQVRREKAYVVNGKELVVKNVLELVLRLHQIAGGFTTTYTETPYIGRGGEEKLRRIAHWHPIVPWEKNPKILEVVDLCAADRQFIIWAAYRPEIDAIVAALQDAYPKESVVQIHGGVSESDRALFRAEYQKGKHKFMVGNTATGGMADTWTACETMIYYNNTEKMIDRAQSEDRAHRDGLDHVVDYVDIVAEKTVDELILKSVARKMDLSEYIRRNIREALAAIQG